MSGIRNQYEKLGVEAFYREHSDDYKNPHFETIKELLLRREFEGQGLDLCCGSGEVTRILQSNSIIGCDPYMSKVYKERTGITALEFDFKDIAKGALSEYRFDYIICSFALHLCEQSMLNQVLYQLSIITDKLVVVSPNKRPVINDNYFLTIYEEKLNRVYLKEYLSKM